MNTLKYFHQEINPECNMKHDRCPVNRIDKYELMDTRQAMSDETILNNIRIAYENGFHGYLSWIFYNEPLMALDRLEPLVSRIKNFHSEARILLWTNGTMIGREVDPDRLSIFTHIVISNYEGRSWRWLTKSRDGVTVLRGKLDNRMTPTPFEIRRGCPNIHGEMIIDYYGNWRLCCGDFLGTAVKMNVHTHGFHYIMESRRRLSALISQDPQPSGVPKVCGTCRLRQNELKGWK